MRVARSLDALAFGLSGTSPRARRTWPVSPSPSYLRIEERELDSGGLN
jgi:hypothetical protein